MKPQYLVHHVNPVQFLSVSASPCLSGSFPLPTIDDRDASTMPQRLTRYRTVSPGPTTLQTISASR